MYVITSERYSSSFQLSLLYKRIMFPTERKEEEYHFINYSEILSDSFQAGEISYESVIAEKLSDKIYYIIEKICSRFQYRSDQFESGLGQYGSSSFPSPARANSAAEDDLEPERVILCCDPSIQREVLEGLAREIKRHDMVELIYVIDFYQYMNIQDPKMIQFILRQNLGTELVDCEDSMNFGYAIYRAIESYL